MQEIAQKLDISKVTVFEHVEALIRKGLLHRQPNRARSLILDPRVRLNDQRKLAEGTREDAIVASEPGSDDVSERQTEYLSDHEGGPVSFGSYAIKGKVAAGLPVETYENQDQLDLGCMFGRSDETFVLQVRGDSMIEEHIRDGDYVLVKKTNQADNGQIVVALLEQGETTLKKFFHDKKGYCLMPCNPNYDPIYPDAVSIQGVVIGVVRNLS
jgi:repressor LexA